MDIDVIEISVMYKWIFRQQPGAESPDVIFPSMGNYFFRHAPDNRNVSRSLFFVFCDFLPSTDFHCHFTFCPIITSWNTKVKIGAFLKLKHLNKTFRPWIPNKIISILLHFITRLTSWKQPDAIIMCSSQVLV